MFSRRPSTRNRSERMRFAVNAMPRHAREAMLRGIEQNEIIAGAYVDSRNGGVCPMLAAHRCGGRTSLGSFARSWDRFTDARKVRPATERELAALRGYLEMSLVAEDTGEESLVGAAKRIRAERAAQVRAADDRAATPTPPDTGERHRARELRHRGFWSWLLPTRRYDVFRDRVAAASEQHSEQRAAELLDGDALERTSGSPPRTEPAPRLRPRTAKDRQDG